ncbi:E3 ubiquitin-protein ligase AIRP2 [Glycine soja]
MYIASMGRSFKDSLKLLEADIHHANTLLEMILRGLASDLCFPSQSTANFLHKYGAFNFAANSWASDFPREYDGTCLQMRMSYSPAAHLFLFFVQWTDCNLAGALGLLRILIYKVRFKVYVDGTTTMSTLERKASIREFYAIIYPSLVQLQESVADTEDKKQKAVCMERYRKRDDEEHRQPSDIDIEREEECGICMEMNSKIVLPDCNHVMCLTCYHEWRTRSQSCPFCRNSLKRVNSGDLWVFTDNRDVVDMATATRENLRRLFMYIDKLPLVIPDFLFDTYDSHLR